MKDYPETHQHGMASIDLDALGGNTAMFVGDFGIQIANDGRVWVCLNGQAFIRFKPLSQKQAEKLRQAIGMRHEQ